MEDVVYNEAEVVFNEYDSTVGYFLGQKSEFTTALRNMTEALGFSEVPRYYWALVEAMPRPGYIVEARIYHSYPEILAHRYRTETARDHIEYAITDAASMVLLKLRKHYDHILSNGPFGLAPDTRGRMQSEEELPITDEWARYLAHIAQGAHHAHNGAILEIDFLRSTLASERSDRIRLHEKAKTIKIALKACRKKRDAVIAQLEGGSPVYHAGAGDAPVPALHAPPSPPPFRRLRHTARKRTLPLRALAGIPHHEAEASASTPSAPTTLEERLRDPANYAPHQSMGYIHSLFTRRG